MFQKRRRRSAQQDFRRVNIFHSLYSFMRKMQKIPFVRYTIQQITNNILIFADYQKQKKVSLNEDFL